VERVGISVHRQILNMPMMSTILMKHLINHQRPPLAIKEKNLMTSMKKKDSTKTGENNNSQANTGEKENNVDSITDS